MPGNVGRLDAMLGPGIPLEDMQIGAADGGSFNSDEDVVRADGRDGTSRISMPGAALGLVSARMVLGRGPG